jgi:hypothetical protein
MINVLNSMPKFLFKLKEIGFNTDITNDYIEYTTQLLGGSIVSGTGTISSSTSASMTSSLIHYNQQQQLNDFFYDCYLIYNLFSKITNFIKITLSISLKQQCSQPYLILDYFVNQTNDLNEYNEQNLLSYLKSKRCLVKIEPVASSSSKQKNHFLNTIDLLSNGSDTHGGINDYRYENSNATATNNLDNMDDYEILSNQQWTCGKCTFLNDADLRYCAMCKGHKHMNAFLD